MATSERVDVRSVSRYTPGPAPLPATARVILANIWVAVLAFAVAAAMAMMQAISRAGLPCRGWRGRRRR